MTDMRNTPMDLDDRLIAGLAADPRLPGCSLAR